MRHKDGSQGCERFLRAPLERGRIEFRAASAALDSQKVSFVELDPVSFQKLAILLFESLRLMMFGLSGDISAKLVDAFFARR